jgi:hypothetical protein
MDEVRHQVVRPCERPPAWVGDWYEIVDPAGDRSTFVRLPDGMPSISRRLASPVVLDTPATSAPLFSFVHPLFVGDPPVGRLVLPWIIYGPSQTWLSFQVPSLLMDVPANDGGMLTPRKMRQLADVDVFRYRFELSVDQITDWIETECPDLSRPQSGLIATFGADGAPAAITSIATWRELKEEVTSAMSKETSGHLIAGWTTPEGYCRWLSP